MSSAQEDRALGSFRGLAVGDALGAPVEFTARGSFPEVTSYRETRHFNLPAGMWTDDTSMALCLADALIACKGYDAFHAMELYRRWYREGYRSPKGYCFDIGNQTRLAIELFEADPYLTTAHRTTSAGNGAIMRLAPAAIVASQLSEAEALALFEVTTIDTHYSLEAVNVSQAYGLLLRKLLLGEQDKERALVEALETVGGRLNHQRELFTWGEEDVNNSGYSVTSFAAAWWAFAKSSSFEETVLRAANLGGDADTIAAIAGQLAGAYYGDEAIPTHLKAGLHESEIFPKLTRELLTVNRGVLRSRLA